MTRLTISLADDLAERIKAEAGDNVSAWLAKVARAELLRQEYAAIAVYEREHDDPAYEAERLTA